jgi:hypothetical protein
MALHCAAASAQEADAKTCGNVARAAEVEFGLPDGLLVAIGKVESRNWPWTANVDGAAETYRSRQEAIDGLNKPRLPQPANIDVGCFQISMKYHPTAFANMAEALDPVANSRYAAKFLRSLWEKFGDWERAAAAYHSATEGSDSDYAQRVVTAWKGTPPVQEQLPHWQVISISAALQPLAGMPDLPRIITVSSITHP